MSPDVEKNPDDSDAERRVRQVELLISNLLRAGVIASLSVIAVGTLMTFIQHPAYVSSRAELQPLTEIGAAFPHSVRDVFEGVLELQGRAVVTAGLLVLIATPVLRVMVSIFAFIYQRDRIFTLITAVVFGLLMLSFVLGRVG